MVTTTETHMAQSYLALLGVIGEACGLDPEEADSLALAVFQPYRRRLPTAATGRRLGEDMAEAARRRATVRKGGERVVSSPEPAPRENP